MPILNQNTNSLLSSRDTAMKLSKIADRFGLNEKQKSLQARILAKLLLSEIKVAELGRVLRINLNLDEKQSEDLSAVLAQEFYPSEKEKAIPVNIARPAQVSQAKEKIAPSLLKSSAGALRDFIDDAIDALRLELSDLQKSRLESSVLTYIKDIRDILETEESLGRSVERGGAGLDLGVVKEIGVRLQKAFSEENKADFLGQKEKRSASRGVAGKPIFDFAPEPEANLYPVLPAKAQAKKPETAVAAPATLAVLPEKKKIMNDVLPKAKAIPPAPVAKDKGLKIEEIKDVTALSDLALENFKIKNPESAGQKIVARVARLVGKNEVARLKSIEAWRASRPYKLYIMIGGESIAQSKTITEIASSRMLKSLPYLTEEEFNAIADASREFQY